MPFAGGKLATAVIEPLIRFREFAAALDLSIKLSTAAIRSFAEQAASSDDKGFISACVVAAEEGWSDNIDVDAHQRSINNALTLLSGLWIVDALASLELFLTQVLAELHRWDAIKKRAVGGKITDEDGKISVSGICIQYGLDSKALDPYLPVLDIFQNIRNCVVHQHGIASSGLSVAGIEEHVKKWPRLESSKKEKAKTPIEAPSFPVITAGKRPTFRPRHAILALVLCRRVAEEMSRSVIQHLGEDGLTFHAAHHAVLSDTPLIGADTKRAEPDLGLKALLSFRYRVVRSQGEVAGSLKKLGIWNKVRTAYSHLLGQRSERRLRARRH